MVKNSIADIKDCYGCGVCTIVCPKDLIRLELNQDGFYYPNLFDIESCTQCGLCVSVCAFVDNKVVMNNEAGFEGFASWSNDNQIRRECTSGGVGFEIGKQLIEDGYKACGVKYNVDQNRAEHFIASSVEEFIPSIKSKYLQSYTIPGFLQFNSKDKFFVSGTPCQIDSIRRYIKKKRIEENFVLLDFYCHGVPSMNMWKKYCEMVEKSTGKIVHASWRNKRTNWNDFSLDNKSEEKGDAIDWEDSKTVLIRGEKGFDYVSRMSKGDIFFNLFLGDVCLNESCYDKCKYKQNISAADIRVGDLWGNTYLGNTEGVSGMLVLTDKGKRVVSKLTNCTLIKENVSVVGEGQHKFPPKRKKSRQIYMFLLRSSMAIENIYRMFYIINLLPGMIKWKVLKIIKLI